MDQEIIKQLIKFQKRDITEHFIYARLARVVKDSHNKEVLRKISQEELNHYHLWKKYTQVEVKPDKLLVLKYYLMSLIFGLTFTLKLINLNDKLNQRKYNHFTSEVAEIEKINREEIEHENHLINLIEEEKLKYVSSMVLGLNDALVELTGTLAGFSLALPNPKIVAMAGLITGISASLSLGASEYLAIKTEGIKERRGKNPLKAAFYTALTYMLVVTALIIPFLIFNNIFISLVFMLAIVIIMISFFTYYVSIAQEFKFKKRFSEMLAVCLGVALVSFSIGFAVKKVFNIIF